VGRRNSAHVGLREIREAARCPVLSMIDVTIDDVVRRKCRRVGVLGFNGAAPPYVDALRRRGIGWEGIDATSQAAVDYDAEAADAAVAMGGRA
jgi:aspartate/glutamate racemase